MKRFLFVMMLLTFAVAAMGAKDAQSWINDGVAAKKAGDNAAAAVAFSKAAEVGKGKIRCVGLRCYLYSLTKGWGDEGMPGGIAEGDKAAEALASEYADDGDAQVARATWWGRRQFELMKAGELAKSVPFGEKSIAARGDFPMFGNNLAVALCDLADAQTGGERKALADKALGILSRYKIEGKLAETKARAERLAK